MKGEHGLRKPLSPRHDMVDQSLQHIPVCLEPEQNPKRCFLWANPRAETVLATNSGLRWSFVKLCGWKSSTRALLSCSCSWRKRQKIKWGCSRKMWVCMCTHSFYRFIDINTCFFSFYWRILKNLISFKPDSSFSWLQHASILNSEIKGSCQTFSAQRSSESICWEKAKLVFCILN